MKEEDHSSAIIKSKKSKRLKLGIKGKLISIFILIIALSNFILGLGAYITSINVVKSQFEDSTKNLANEMNREIDLYFQKFEEGVKFMASDSNVQLAYVDEECADWMMKSFKNFISSYGDVANIYLGTINGDMFVYPEVNLPSDFDPRNRDWYIETVNNKELTWINPYIDTATKELVITAGVPVYDNVDPNKLIGVLGIDIKLETLSKLPTYVTVGKEGGLTIYDKGGTILIHKDSNLIGETSSEPELLEAIKSGNISFLEYKSDENGAVKKKLATINVMDRLEWRIVSSTYLDDISGFTNRILYYTSIIGVISLVLAIIFVFIFSRSITEPIVFLSNNMKRVKDGDFTIRVSDNREDEIGILNQNFNIMINNLSNLIGVIQNVSSEVSASAQHLAATAEETSASSEEVSRTVEEIAKGASEQAQDSETGVMLVTGLADRLAELTDRSNEMFEVARDVLETSMNSVKIANELQSKTELNNTASDEVEKGIFNLAEKIKYIGSILETINSIAEQTNLLALNASIEAARAGEYGKGFAVVADEIRKLSYDSRDSSDKIREIIEAIQNDSQHTVDTMRNMRVRTKEQTQAVLEVNTAFAKISNAVEKMVEKIEMINDYVNDMNRDKDKIVESIENISSISEETAAASEEVTASMEQQSAAVHEVAEAANKLNELSLSLNEEIKKFKI